jgi:hypothetical protein
LGFLRREGALAVVTGQRLALGIHVVFAADLVATGASPTDCHRSPHPPPDDLVGKKNST